MLATTAIAIVLSINAATPLIEAIALHKNNWNLSMSVVRDMQKQEFWNQSSKSILYTRLSILKYTRPRGSESLLLDHIDLRNNDPATKDIIEMVYPVYGVLSHYDSNLVDAIFIRVSSLEGVDQSARKIILSLCFKLLEKYYFDDVEGRALLRKRIQREIDSQPKDKRESLIALLKLTDK